MGSAPTRAVEPEVVGSAPHRSGEQGRKGWPLAASRSDGEWGGRGEYSHAPRNPLGPRKQIVLKTSKDQGVQEHLVNVKRGELGDKFTLIQELAK
ncbi:hypothetical protein AVEN_95377-1 [Araneus ventricosus]|uniref:Uncharacterized protein n=1 Tax=Araneus ventricosus TaxID=182803 RepID=A0A4Y2CHQ4_ARAVE|nr:hypothetical protein AVEN_95377-1 [Araneus ventricosus]